MKNTKSLKDASLLFCPNEDGPARGKMGAGNIVSHGKARERYQCKLCKKTFNAHRGTMFEGLRKPKELIVIVVTLLAYGCPPQAIVHALDLDERTVARWQERAGVHCQKVHQDQVMQAQLDLQHVQADEIRAKGCKMIPWMAMAMMVSTRLWLGGVVSLRRDRHLADQVRAKDQGSKEDALITPAMASDLTDHIWSMREVLTYRIAPPPWVEPSRRGRTKRADQLPSSLSPPQSRPLLRLRKGVLCTSAR